MKKNNTQRASARKSGGGTLMGVFIGLVFGLVLAFALVWFFNRMPLPFRTQEAAPVAAETPGPSAPVSLPGKPGDKPREKQQLEFYDLLEGKPAKGSDAAAGAAVTPPAASSTAKTPAPGVAKEATNEGATGDTAEVSAAPPVDVFFLQVGAFQNKADVDSLKAKLALQGFEANVQEVAVPNKGVMQRVRVGPFRSMTDMSRARNTLLQGGVQTTVVKQKELVAP
jgi:cell division protein FtsN